MLNRYMSKTGFKSVKGKCEKRSKTVRHEKHAILHVFVTLVTSGDVTNHSSNMYVCSLDQACLKVGSCEVSS